MKNTIIAGLLLSSVITLTGCSPKVEEKVDLTIMATSDLKDVLPDETINLKTMLKEETGLNVAFSFGRTMDTIEGIQNGTVTSDTAWVSNAKLLLSNPEGQKKVLLQEKIMYSPLVLGVSQSAVSKFGWDAQNVTWKNITEKAKTGELKYAMSNPTTSNQGFSALIGVASAFSNKTEALTKEDINYAQLSDFFKGYTLIGDNSAWLMDRFVEEQGKTVNAYINYESILTSFNDRLSDKLVLIYPKEGISMADYPFMLLKENKREQYLKVVNALKGEKIQTWLATKTKRRVVNEKIAEKLNSQFSQNTLIELSFPTDSTVIDMLLDSFMNKQKKPSAAIFVVDVSGSMSGEREEILKKAFTMLNGSDTSLTGRLSKFREREKVWIVPFNGDVLNPTYFNFGKDKNSVVATTQTITQFINELNMDGGTAVYSSLKTGLTIAMNEQKKNPDYNYTVVLFTDGESNSGDTFKEFIDFYQQTGTNIHVFPILFGEGNKEELSKVASITKGKTFDGTSQSLTAVFKEIRGYQ